MTPSDDDPLAAVLAEIAKIEARPGFEGPKIGRRLQLIRISAYADHGDNGEEVFGDRVVGKIVRACEHRGYIVQLNPRHLTNRSLAEIHVHHIGDGWLQIKRREPTLSVALAKAYRDALKSSLGGI